MPIYEYACKKCGEFETMQRITDRPLTRCPTCKGKVTKLMSHTSFQLKGSGWYVTDYAKKDAGAGKETGGKDTGGDKDSGTKAKGESASEGSSDSGGEASSSSASSDVKSSTPETKSSGTGKKSSGKEKAAA